MFNESILLIQNLSTEFWLSLVLLLVFGIGYLSFKLSQRFVMRYLQTDLSAAIMTAVIVFHFVGSFVMGLILPNNFLIELDFFHWLYNQSELWIPVSMLALIFLFITTIGSFWSIICRIFPQRETEDVRMIGS